MEDARRAQGNQEFFNILARRLQKFNVFHSGTGGGGEGQAENARRCLGERSGRARVSFELRLSRIRDCGRPGYDVK